MAKVYERKQDIMTADMAGETVMMDINTGKYYNLGAVGGSIWSLLANPMTEEELVRKLMAEYDVSAEDCARDIAPFLRKLTENGLVKVGEG